MVGHYERYGDGEGERPVSVWVVSPYPSVRAGLRVLLEADARLAVVGEGSGLPLAGLSGAAATSSVADVFVIDVAAAGALEAAIEDAEDLTPAGLVLLGPPPDDPRLLAHLGARPWGYVGSDADAAEIATAIATVHAGLLAIDPAIGARLFVPSLAPRPPADEGQVEELTPRELEVLTLLAEGIPNKAIARRLGISDHTVKFHVGSLLAKLGAASRTEAVRLGARRGLIAL